MAQSTQRLAYKVIAPDAGRTLATHCVVASSAWRRMIGLLNHNQLPEGEALLIEPCKQVHMFFMRFAIDAVFVSKNNIVLGICELKPWRLSPLYLKAHKVLELPAGVCRDTGLRVGDRLEFVAW